MKNYNFHDQYQTVWKRLLTLAMMLIVTLLLVDGLAVSHISNGAQSLSSVRSPLSLQTPAAEQSAAQTYFTDVELVNQHGEKMRFYTDLIKGKVVIISSFFSTCQGSCSLMFRNLEKIQQSLGARVGKDVWMISISVDPTVDTPVRLKEYAKKVNAGPGWYFLTGEKQNVEFALKKIGHFVDKKEEHLTVIIIGNESTGLWKKAVGVAKSEELVKVVESVANDKPPEKK
jgi:protein SCO1/2